MINVEFKELDSLADFNSYKEEVNNEFIFSKGRSVCLEKRFPDVFILKSPISKVFIIKREKQLVGGVVVKLFDLIQNCKIYKCAMLGFVWITPSFRGEKLGSKLVDGINYWLVQNKFDLAFLWTTKPMFYERLNWRMGKGNFFGELVSIIELKSNITVYKVNKLSAELFISLEAFRKNKSEIFIKRRLDSYNVIPVPAERVEFFLSTDSNNMLLGYAAVGIVNSNAYIYELLGDGEIILSILSYIKCLFKQVFLNISKNDSNFSYIFDSGIFNLNEQPLSMFYIINQNIGENVAQQLYIPYFDRI